MYICSLNVLKFLKNIDAIGSFIVRIGRFYRTYILNNNAADNVLATFLDRLYLVFYISEFGNSNFFHQNDILILVDFMERG